jgi:gamma-glutamyltranspeptidase/glutathione hydrolase
MVTTAETPGLRRAKAIAATAVIAIFIVGAFAFAVVRHITSAPWRRHEEGHADSPTQGPRANAAVATSHPMATRAAHAVLAEGGTAADAALAAALVLGVVEPYNAGLGGGGFVLVHDGRTGEDWSLDFRERAPAALDRDRLIDAVVKNPSALRDGALAVAIPGEWSGLVALHRKYGRLPMSRLARPAIAHAQNGIAVDADYSMRCLFRMGALRADAESRHTLLGTAGICPLAGWTLRQPELAKTLAALTDDTHPASWADRVARPMVEYLAGLGAAASAADAVEPTPVERRTVSGTFHGYRVVSMGPPSSGGLIVISWLQTYERARRRLPDADRLHLWIDAARLSYRDRAELMGDPDFVDVPSTRVASAEYADTQASRLLPEAPLALSADAPSAAEGQHTTHLSIVDGDGLAVAMTVSLNLPFGSGLTVPGTGVLLNDQMDDFYCGHANAFGLVGNPKNVPEAAKRPLSSMAPTMVFDEAGLYVVLGSPGGSTIPTAVATVIRNLVEDHMDPGAAIHAPRIHHQWVPDHVEVERGFSVDLPADMRKTAALARFPIGNVQMIVRTDQGFRGVSDCRGRGEAWSGHVP